MIRNFLKTASVFLALGAVLAISGASSASAMVQYNTNHSTSTLQNRFANIANPQAPIGKITLVSQSHAETWPHQTHHTILWTASSTLKGGTVAAYLVPVAVSGSSSVPTGAPQIAISGNTEVLKGTLSIKVNNFEKAPLGTYIVKIVYSDPQTHSNRGDGTVLTTSITSTSTGVVTVTAHLPAHITITSPIGTDQWKTGTSQKVTWTSNFLKGHSTDALFTDIKVVPEYGVDPHPKVDLSAFSPADRMLLGGLSPSDLNGLSKLLPSQLAALDPSKVLSLPGISPAGLDTISKLSMPGFSMLKVVDPTSLKGITQALLAPVTAFVPPDPLTQVFSSFLGGLFGSDAPPQVHATIYLTPAAGGADIKLKGTTVEVSKTNISLRGVKAGTYTLKIVAKLKESTITGVSAPFKIVDSNSTNTGATTTASVWDGVSDWMTTL